MSEDTRCPRYEACSHRLERELNIRQFLDSHKYDTWKALLEIQCNGEEFENCGAYDRKIMEKEEL